MLQDFFSRMGELLEGILTGNLSNSQFIDLSIIIIFFSIILIIISIIVLLFFSKKSSEEKVVEKILLEMDNLKKGNRIIVEKEKNIGQKNLKTNSEINLKQLLIKKFQPIIEEQLKTKVVVKEFNSLKQNFVVKINVQDNDLELILDSSGKIIDYKKL